MRKVAEGLPREGGVKKKRIGGARETWGDSAKKGKQHRGAEGKKSRRAEKRGEERTKCGSTGEEEEAKRVRESILEWYRDARGTGYRQRIDDVIPATRRIACVVRRCTLDRYDSRDRDPSPGLRLPTRELPRIQRSGASFLRRRVSLARRGTDDHGDRKRSVRTTGPSSSRLFGNPPWGKEKDARVSHAR